jgi:exosortase
MASVADQLPERAPAEVQRNIPWVAICWFAGLLIVANFPILRHLVEQWATDEDFSHGFIVPVVACYIAWRKREEILRMELKPSWWGFPVMLWGVTQCYLGLLGAELFLQRSSILIALLGMVILIGGAPLVRVLLFPLLLLPFMIPLPTVIYNEITFKLQILASVVAESTLNLIGIPVYRDGNILHLASQDLSVAEACSGIRGLLSLTFFSLVYAYFFDKKVWMRWALLFGTIPLCILANSARVTITGILSEINTDYAKGAFHEAEGYVIYVADLILLVGLHWAINRIYRWKQGEKAIA